MVLRRRRQFIRQSAVTLVAALPVCAWAKPPVSQSVTVGLVTDIHYADKPPAGTRHYRLSAGKLQDAAQAFAQSSPDMVVELGDLIDAADSVKTELRYLGTINQHFQKMSAQRHYVLGNHCVDTLTKQEFLSAVGQPRSYYSFDHSGVHFVVLDSCFRSDGKPYQRKNFTWTDANVPDHELEWLQRDLASTEHPTVVFAHQRLDVPGSHGVRNQEDVRSILQQSEKVVAVFQGHSHKNDLRTVDGIHYCTLVAMVEGGDPVDNGYSLLKVSSDGTVHLSGYRRQKSYDWSA